jgi:hypothetical protein
VLVGKVGVQIREHPRKSAVIALGFSVLISVIRVNQW